MAILLNIDTATERAGICISEKEKILAVEESNEQKNHAIFIQSAIKKVITQSGKHLSNIDAISVTHGPGSYTGLRVGLATAKGLCYALHKPLILINTLKVMAFASIQNTKNEKNNLLFCPMIDARRLEVFTAIYNSKLQNVLAPTAMILNETSFASQLDISKIVFSGSGIIKMSGLICHQNVILSNIKMQVHHLAFLAQEAFKQKKFNNIAYSEPLYLKEFFTPSK